jgi:hypothetical protein
MHSSAVSDSLHEISMMIARERLSVSCVRATFASNAAKAIDACGNVLGDPRGAAPWTAAWSSRDDAQRTARRCVAITRAGAMTERKPLIASTRRKHMDFLSNRGG